MSFGNNSLFLTLILPCIAISWHILLPTTAAYTLPSSRNSIISHHDSPTLSRRSFFTASGIISSACLAPPINPSTAAAAEPLPPPDFHTIPKRYIAALAADPNASSGNNALQWGTWTVDPGPRGVLLSDYATTHGVGPDGWKFDSRDWWLEEHGIIMEHPDYPVREGKYWVTGGREQTAVLSVDGDGGWKLENEEEGGGAVRIKDVTHLPRRSARYQQPAAGNRDGRNTCFPANAPQWGFPVRAGVVMPDVGGCEKQDYAVLFLVGVHD